MLGGRDMIPKLNGYRLYEDLVEPILIIDLEKNIVTYCNEACKQLGLSYENMDVNELSKTIISIDDYKTIRENITKGNREYIISDVVLNGGMLGEIIGDIRIGYVDSQGKQVYLMFKYNQEQLKLLLLKNRCFDMLYTLSLAYPFRLDVKTRTICFIGPILEHFKLEPTMMDYPSAVVDSGLIHKDDIEIFKSLVDKMYRGESADEVFRAYTPEGNILYYKAVYTVDCDESGEVTEVVGEFINVQEEKELEIKLHTDELTKCLNKATFEGFATKLIEKSTEEETHVLLIVDIDNFKAINDNLGHQFGDVVLRELGKKLRKAFRSHDYVGRIGGDEFMVLMKSVDNLGIIEERVENIVKAFDNTYKGNTKSYRTTASIGISQYPKDGNDFATLYKKADIALYDTKSKGKNGYTYYDSVMTEGNMSNTTPFDAATRALSQHFDQKIIAEVFTLLTEAKDYDASINKVLELLGIRFNAERCYIFESASDESMFWNNTYEWCAEGITAEIDNLQMIPKEAYQPLIELANSDGVFYCNDLEVFKGQATFDVIRDQGIESFLISFNMVGGAMTSMVGFDDCTSARIWSSIEISTLMHASKIINQFLKYTKTLKKLNVVLSERLNDIL